MEHLKDSGLKDYLGNAIIEGAILENRAGDFQVELSAMIDIIEFAIKNVEIESLPVVTFMRVIGNQNETKSRV